MKILLRVIPFLFIQPAFALNLQGYQFSDSYRYALLEDSLKESFDGPYVATLSYGYIHSPFYYSDTYLHDMRGEIIESNNILTMGFSWYVGKNLAIGADVALINNEVFDETHTTFGDTIFKSRINLMRRKDFSLSLNPKVFLPTGDEENFSSMGSIGGALNLVGEKTINRFHLLASLGALSSRDNQYVDVDHRQLLLAQLGISYDVTDEWKINLESYRNFPLVNDKLQDEGKYFLTGRHETHKYITTYFGAGVTGWGEIQRNTYSAFAGIKIHESSLVPQTITTKAASPQKQTERPPEEIYFAHDKHELEEKEKEKLGDYAVFLSQPQNKIKVVILEGHASSVGEFNYNMTLSYKRAHAVREYLLRQGVPQKLLSIKAFGETAKQDQQEWKNRKVHFNIEQED